MGRRRRRRRYRFKARFWVIIVVLLVLIVAGCALLLRSCSPEEKPEGAAPAKGATALAETADAGDEYLSRILFIGDSRTLGLAEYEYLPSSQVYAAESLTHKAARDDKFVSVDGKDVSLTTAVQAKKPEIMLVAFGINGMESMTAEEFMREYTGLVEDLKKASPDSVIIIQSIYPVSKAVDVERPKMNNATIAKYNKKLLDLAKDQGCYFLDTASALTNGEGMLDEAFDAGDGIHIGPSGYEAILKYVREHAVPGKSSAAGAPSSGKSSSGGSPSDPSSSSEDDSTSSQDGSSSEDGDGSSSGSSSSK